MSTWVKRKVTDLGEFAEILGGGNKEEFVIYAPRFPVASNTKSKPSPSFVAVVSDVKPCRKPNDVCNAVTRSSLTSTEYHVHACEDEAVYVLSGTGTARTGDDTHDISSGDFIGYPKGGPAHEIRNTSDRPLRLLVIGQRLSEGIVDYPDQNKRLYRCAGRPNDLVDIGRIIPLGSTD
ncbi:cupin domain-containing protein [uncultured Ruegeria sp.]|uniref:cupin domain-containing protein n=1 Tax=uncultured Ruegeria sp. TaxID=259304 RepID=UPI00261EFB11|nr:cupin domain-containing protein [uncultured Ruegeria sp.]